MQDLRSQCCCAPMNRHGKAPSSVSAVSRLLPDRWLPSGSLLMHDDVPALSAESLPVLAGDNLLNPDLAMRSVIRHWRLRPGRGRRFRHCFHSALFRDHLPASARSEPCEEALQPGPQQDHERGDGDHHERDEQGTLPRSRAASEHGRQGRACRTHAGRPCYDSAADIRHTTERTVACPLGGAADLANTSRCRCCGRPRRARWSRRRPDVRPRRTRNASMRRDLVARRLPPCASRNCLPMPVTGDTVGGSHSAVEGITPEAGLTFGPEGRQPRPAASATHRKCGPGAALASAQPGGTGYWRGAR